jgi:D-alanine transaminase
MTPPMSRAALLNVIKQTIVRNRVRDGLVYIQVSRGAGPRDFVFPADDIQPTVVVIARRQDAAKIAATAAAGIAVTTMPDIRWGRSDVKTVMLLPACLAKNEGRDRGAKEVWLVDASGNVTEGASSNAWIVTSDGRLVTRHLDPRILPGVTRATVIDAAAAAQLNIDERAFSVAEAYVAKEAFITSATNTVMPVVRIDEHVIGDGKPGPLTLKLRSEFHHKAETLAF